jgi:hypothetical protein
MNKMVVLLAVLALTGCAETSNEGAYLLGGAGRAPGGGGDDVASAPAHQVARDVAPREIAARHAQRAHEADFVVCAQCRH